MSLTVKEILDAVKGESGLPLSDQYFGGVETLITALLNRSARNFSQEEYSGLRTDGSITMTAATSYAVPSDLRYIVADTMNVQDQEKYIKFPTNNTEWWYLKTHTNSSGINYKFRFQNGELHVHNPQVGEIIEFEYISDNVVLSTGSASADKARFTADSDTWLLDDDLLILDVKWRLKLEMGIEGWQNDKQLYENYRKIHKGKEAGAGTINMGGQTQHIDIPYTDLYI